MIDSLKQGFKSFHYLFSFTNYKRGEIVLKYLFLPVALFFFVPLFVLTFMFLLIERVLAPAFKKFLIFQMKMIQKRAHAKPWPRRFYSIVTFIVTLVLLPFVVLYYLSMLFKTLGKSLLKNIIIKLDFSVEYSKATLMIFDDQERLNQSAFSSMMTDAQQTEELGKILERYFNEAPELHDPDIFDEDDLDNR